MALTSGKASRRVRCFPVYNYWWYGYFVCYWLSVDGLSSDMCMYFKSGIEMFEIQGQGIVMMQSIQIRIIVLSLTDLAKSVYVIGLWHCHPVSLASSSLSSVYSAPGHMVNTIEFICGIYIGILSPFMHIK